MIKKKNKNVFSYTKKILGYNFFIIPFIYILFTYNDLTSNKLILFIVAIYFLVIITH